MLSNKDIIRQLRLATSLMELHNENAFKIRSYQNAVAALERLGEPLADMDAEQLASLEGVGKSLAASIKELLASGSFPQLNELLDKTPEGVVAMLDIKGLGPKKIRQIWQELGIEDADALLLACEEDALCKVKGFGNKTQETIRQALLFSRANIGKVRYADIEATAEALEKSLQEQFKEAPLALSGQYRRRLDVLDNLSLLIGHTRPEEVFGFINTLEGLQQQLERSGPFAWRGKILAFKLDFEVHVCPPEAFTNMQFKLTGAATHLRAQLESGRSLLQVAEEQLYSSEEAIYQAAKLAYVAPELREGLFEVPLAEKDALPELLEYGQLKGSLHNHSTYSDGKHSLREMAEHCRSLGYEYLGISDHSRTASYAGGLEVEKVLQQHEEIEQLNKEMAPFRIFKGIESDILSDGALDYPDDILARFDFIVASIHGNLNMGLKKATDRLLTAIRNPYTTILGHPTGRLLLRREGYPIDHRAVIDACAEEGVIIEINANPWRLDMDWRWVQYALEKGVILSINPDAHEKDGFHDMYYGVLTGRKGGLTADMTFNTRSAAEVEQYFSKRKEKSITQA
jgi:DNA polymerase (family 10)